MDLKERELFWQTLCSLKGENPQDKVKQLFEKIITPTDHLYENSSI